MLTQIINGRILTPQGWLKDGSVLICDGKILEVTNSDLAVIGATVIDARGMTIVPGFVSMHAHGGGGHDFTEATEEAFRMATTAHLKHGATSMFPTLSSTSFEKLYQAVDVCEGLMQEPDSPILGLHIEGPYLNPKMAGSQYEGFLKTPDENEYIPLLEHTTCIKRWDISPELRGAHDFAKYTRSKGIMTAVTHTEADGHLEELTRIFSFSYVILDASLSEYRRHLLESECKQSGLRFISLSDEGSVRFLL